MKRWPMETIVSLSALLLSLVGVATNVVQTTLMMRQQRASMWPMLEWSNGNVGGCYVSLSNEGTGPAKILLFDMEWNGIHFEEPMDLADHIQDADSRAPKGATTSSVSGRTLRPGERVKPILVSEKASEDFCRDLIMHGFNVRIVYASVYDDCWELTGQGTRQLSRCPSD